MKRLVLGSVFESVVHHALSPVLVLRGGGDAWPPRRVVIGDDGSEAARVAASLAAGIGGLFGAQGLVLRAYPELPEADLEGRPRFMTGSAAKVMAKKLKEKGGSLLVDSESFFVKGMEGPLRSGELDRAATWARMLVKEVEPTHLGAQQ